MATKAELQAERDHYKELAENGLAPMIKSMHLEDGRFEMAVVGPMMELLACTFVAAFKEGGATNFMEMSLFDRDEPFQRYTVTVQKVGAKSPADLLNEAKRELAAIQARPSPHVRKGD